MGYIGSHTTVELIEAGYEVVIVDDLSNSVASVLDGIESLTGVRPTFYKASCNDVNAINHIFEIENPISGIIHFAASKAVGESVQNPLLYYHNNIVSLLNILGAMRDYRVKGLVFSSSCTVYGQPEKLPVTEKAPILPATSPYGNTKQINEEIIHDTIRSGSFEFKAIILRYFNPIGGHKSALIGELPRGVPQNLVPFLTQATAGLRPALTVFGNDYNTPDGTCIRDYIDVVDLAKAHVVAIDRILQVQDASPVETFNIGTGRGISVLELIQSFEEANGVKVPYQIGAKREGDTEQVWADPTMANNILGWKAQTPLKETLQNAWRWQQKLVANNNK